MFDEFDKPSEQEQEPSPYTLRAKRIEHQALTEQGATVYVVEGWELLTLLLANTEYFEQDESSWYGVCQGGEVRSDLCNRLLKAIGIPKSKDQTIGKRGEGLSIWELITKLSQSVFKDGKFYFEDFSSGINRFIYFLSPQIVDQESVLRFFAKSLKQVNSEDSEEMNATFFVVTDNERRFGFLCKEVQKMLGEGQSKEKIIEYINEKNNDKKATKKLDVSDPQNLFK